MTSLTEEGMKCTVNWKLCNLLFYLHKQVQTVPDSEILKGRISVPQICICVVLVFAQHLPLTLNDNYYGILKCGRCSFRRLKLISQADPDWEICHCSCTVEHLHALVKHNLELVLVLHFILYSSKSTGYGFWSECRAGGKIRKFQCTVLCFRTFYQVFFLSWQWFLMPYWFNANWKNQRTSNWRALFFLLTCIFVVK